MKLDSGDRRKETSELTHENFEYKIKGKELKIEFLTGHFSFPEGRTYKILCEEEKPIDDKKTLKLLETIGRSINVSLKAADLIEKKATELSDEEFEEIKQEMQNVLLSSIKLMSKDKIDLRGIAVKDIKSDFSTEDDFIYLPYFSFGKITSLNDGKEFVLQLDSDLKFDSVPNKGIKYSRLLKE